jgi:hypothetical protein
MFNHDFAYFKDTLRQLIDFGLKGVQGWNPCTPFKVPKA